MEMKGKVVYTNPASSRGEDLDILSIVHLVEAGGVAIDADALVVWRHRGGPGHEKAEVVFFQGERLVNLWITFFGNWVGGYDTLSPEKEGEIRRRFPKYLDRLKKK